MTQPNRSSLALATLIAVFAVSSTGCDLFGKKSDSSTDPTSSGNPTGEGGTFTGSDLNGTWTSSCLSFTGGISGEIYYKNTLTIQNGTDWFLTQDTFSANSLGCNLGAEGVAHWLTAGTFTVGGITSGSTQSIQFTANGATIMPLNGGAAWLNSHSSFTSYSNGTTKNIFSPAVTINGIYTASAGTTTIDNVGTLSNHVLTLGAGFETIPGAFQGVQTAPTTATVSYSYSP